MSHEGGPEVEKDRNAKAGSGLPTTLSSNTAEEYVTGAPSPSYLPVKDPQRVLRPWAPRRQGSHRCQVCTWLRAPDAGHTKPLLGNTCLPSRSRDPPSYLRGPGRKYSSPFSGRTTTLKVHTEGARKMGGNCKFQKATLWEGPPRILEQKILRVSPWLQSRFIPLQ